ncbi:hypothetical protein [Flavobacterium sp.]|uniref:hypothetical protein n=1 Tax=Flavobacterium sp. TaxID=239 RepID=UPI0037505B28
MKKVFEQNPTLEKYYGTTDGEAFYNENDAKNHAKKLEVKTVETVYNEKFLEVVDAEELSDSEKEMAEFEAAEKAKADQEAADEKEAIAKTELAKSLAAFDSETTKYPEALKLFKALGLEAENEKKDTIYPLLVAAKTSAQEGVEPKTEN